jgi:hypothetical protein
MWYFKTNHAQAEQPNMIEHAGCGVLKIGHLLMKFEKKDAKHPQW